METVKVDSFLALLQAAQRITRELKAPCWYRGQAKDRPDWIIRPNVFRDHTDVEANLFRNFVLSAPSRHGACPDGRDPARWLPLMQHYGVPTRMLDWSCSVVVAAFFAVDYDAALANAGDNVVWTLQPGLLNDRFFDWGPGVALVDDGPISHLLEAVGRGKHDLEQVVAVAAHETDLRMMLQQCAYTIHGSPTPLDEFENAAEFLRKITITPAGRKDIRDVLRLIHTNHSTLFPDLHNLAITLSGKRYRTPVAAEIATPDTGPAAIE
jgi:hypothetical protein